MPEKLDAVVPKIVPLIRMFAAPSEGEKLNAVRALLRLLANAGLDIHALVNRIEHGGEAPLSAGEMQRIYDAAYEKGFADGNAHGRRTAVIAAAAPIGTFGASVGSGINGYSWQQIANHCAGNKHVFHGRDFDFVESIAEQLSFRADPSPAQAKWLRDLFMRKFGGRIE
jgi:hypothetical protein